MHLYLNVVFSDEELEKQVPFEYKLPNGNFVGGVTYHFEGNEEIISQSLEVIQEGYRRIIERKCL